MSKISAGLIKTTNLTVTGLGSGAVTATNFQFTNLDLSGNLSVTGASTLGSVAALGALDVSGNTTLKTTSVSGTLGVTGATTLAGTSVRSLTTPSGFSVDTSANLIVPGTITNPTVVTNSQLMENTVMSAGSIYTIPGSATAAGYVYPIIDLQANIPIGVFTDRNNTTVSEEFLTKNSDTNCPSGKIYYYAGDGTKDFPIDGTAGSPHFSGVYGNIGTPIFVDVSDSSAYELAIKENFKMAPAITDNSGNTVGGTFVNMNYSSYCDTNGFTFSGFKDIVDKVYRYYIKRGWAIPTAPYVAYDACGNDMDIHYFHQCYYSDDGAPTLGIDFDFSGSKYIPSSINISFGIYVAFSIGPPVFAASLPSCQQVVNIPITTDKVIYGNAVINGTNSVYYDINKRIITINFVQESSWTYTVDSSNFATQSYTLTHIMKKLTGSWAVVKPGDGTFQSNGYSVNNFVSCPPSDAACSLIQVSPTINMVANLIYDGIDYGNNVFEQPLLQELTGEYFGYTLTKFGYGKTGSIINVINPGIYNSSANIDTKWITPSASGKAHVGNNPYTRFYQTTVTGSKVDEYSNKWNIVCPKFNVDLFSTTPESMALLDASYCEILSDNNLADLSVLIHEHQHIFEESNGTVGFAGNAEGHATTMELDGYLMGAGTSVTLRMFRSCMAYLNSHYKGWYTFEQNGKYDYQNNLYTASKLGISNQNYSTRIPYITASQYSEGFAFRYFTDHYDPNNQIIRRSNEINICNMKVMTDNGFTSLLDSLYPCVNSSKFSYAQALWEVSSANGAGKELPTGYSEYALSTLFLRNNNSIPVKYRYLFPIWLTNKHNQFSSVLGQCATALDPLYPQILGGCLWSDIDESTPIYTEKYGRAATFTGSFSFFDAETVIPFWPRNAPLEAQYKMGTWKRNSSGRLLDVSNNFIYNTSTGAINLSAGSPVWTPSVVAYKTSETIYLENLSTKAYVLPVTGNSGLGLTSSMTSVTVRVLRGNFNFAIAQFVPNGGDGTWTQLPSSGTFYNINNPGTWNDASGEIYDNVQTGYLDAASPVSYTFNLSGLSVQTYNGVKYYPKLVCVNATLDTYGQYLDISPARCRYSGKVTITPTFV